MVTEYDSTSRSDLIRKLRDPAAYPHAVRDLQVIETHISWVILTGDFAYKVKKPVVLGFLDFSSLQRRKFFCEEELRVNRRTAPDLYLDVVPVGSTPDGLRIGAEPAIEFAVRMHQFPHSSRLDRCLHTGMLERKDMRALAEMIARFHRALPPRENADPFFEFERATKPARNNFIHLDPALFSNEEQQHLAVIEAWTLQQAESLGSAFKKRAGSGSIRECHGDLHLENLLLQEGRFIPFDAIEFNPNLRWIDTANDTAFLVMDLMARGRDDMAFTLLNAWLEETGDYASLEVMRFYLVYRSMVRAVVTSIRQRQRSGNPEESSRLDAGGYIQLAASLVDTPPPRLFLMHGFSGSGKTWLSERLVGDLPALRVRSDLERKRLPGPLSRLAGAGRIESGMYRPELTGLTYSTLARYCETGLRAGFDMIADATFIRRHYRNMFFDLAADVGARAVILDCATPRDVLRARIRQRSIENEDASDADLRVLEHQLAQHDPLGEDEKSLTVAMNGDQATLCRMLRC
jgi:aminoglycoside phosphotransferase family enzyme/predicted kinase